jgi:hypothetical protein
VVEVKTVGLESLHFFWYLQVGLGMGYMFLVSVNILRSGNVIFVFTDWKFSRLIFYVSFSLDYFVRGYCAALLHVELGLNKSFFPLFLFLFLYF